MRLLPPPGPERQRQLLMLSVMVVVLAGSLWYTLRPAGSGPAASNLARPAAAPAGTLAVPAPVKLDALNEAAEDAAVGRNPFGFGVKPAPPPPPTPARVYTPPPAPAAPPQPTGPPPIALKLIGMTQVPGSTQTMVTVKDPASGALFNGVEGDVLDGRFRIVKVGVQSMIVSYVDGTGTRTIPLGN